MKQILDARGLACPQPVIITKNALSSHGEVTTIVDNKTALENITRMAESAGCTISSEEKNDGIYITIKKNAGSAPEALSGIDPSDYVCSPAGPRVLVMSQDVMGRGNDELGQILVKSFFHTLAETKPAPDVIIFLNSGVKLVVDDSPVLEDIRLLEKNGARILACGTCLDFFKLKEKISSGSISNMYEIKELMLTASSTINL